jgi:hypothetical protein
VFLVLVLKAPRMAAAIAHPALVRRRSRGRQRVVG